MQDRIALQWPPHRTVHVMQEARISNVSYHEMPHQPARDLYVQVLRS